MRGGFVLAILSILFLQCAHKEVQLPVLHTEGTGEIQNHSGIWIFLETDGTDTTAVLNKNNKLQNTHWIFHIDKRLPMGEIAPLLNRMQEDHDKDSMHKKQGMLNYYSFADPSQQSMSLLPFSKTHYEITVIGNIAEQVADSCKIMLELQSEGFAWKGRKVSLAQLAELYREQENCEDGKVAKVQLFYPHNLSYQLYMERKAALLEGGISTDEKEWVIRIK